ncbi:CRTAC1 family protein [Verrucomicrobia bacterium]|nr:CRTAC1 family protein [Verrucomicrobiota bacterium]
MKRCFFPASTGWCAYGLIAGMLLAGWGYVSPVHGSDVRSWALQVPETETTGFEQVDPVTSGILFTNTLQEFTGASNRVLFNGAGVAVGDVNADGRPDLFLCGLEVENQLYSNLGDWQFKRMPIPDALASPGFPSRGAVFADLNADHQLDLLLTTVGGGCRAFLNLGAGRFEPMAGNAGIATQGGASSVTLADVDGNATLDLYVAFNRSDDIRDHGRVNLKRRNGTIVPPEALKDRLLVHRGQLNEYGEPDVLYLNDGSGNLTPVAWTGGHFRNEGKPLPSIPRDWGLSASFRDMNGDLAPDLYVCNDYWTPDRIWLNDGRGGFDALTLDSLATTSASSMGLDFADVNQDGLMDIFVVDMLSRDHVLRKRQQPALNPLFDSPAFSGKRRQIMQNTLFLQRPDATFQEVAQAAGLVASDWSWSPIFMDVDLDGDADLLVSAGYPHDVQDMDAIQRIARLQHSWERYKDPVALRKAFAEELMEHYRLYPKLDLPVMAFENRGDGSFREMTHLWGTDRPGIHQGFATGDLDGDGDRDLVLNDLNGAVLLYRNLADGPRAKVKLVGDGGNTQGIGAKLILRGSGFPPQSREVIAGGRYLSGCDTSVTFAMPDGPGAWTLEVLWRDGNVTSLPDIRSNHAYEIGPSTDLKASIDSKVPAEAFPFPTVTSIPVGDGKINGLSSPPPCHSRFYHSSCILQTGTWNQRILIRMA